MFWISSSKSLRGPASPCVRAALLLLALLLAPAPFAQKRGAAPEPYDFHARRYVDYVFEIEESGTVFGQSVFVSGNIPELGDDNAANSIRLSPANFPIWRATVSVPRGASFSYQYLLREDAANRLPDPTNGTPIGEALLGKPADILGGEESVRVAIPFANDWAFAAVSSNGAEEIFPLLPTATGDATLLPRRLHATWRVGSGSATTSASFPMEAERVYLNANATQAFDYPAPLATLSAPRIVVHNGFASTILGNSRSLRVYLPRGYDQNADREYPVLYMHDGQNIFRPGGGFGTWAVEDAMTAAIASAAAPEMVVVGIDNTNDRLTEYTPPYSVIFGEQGRGDLYLRFVVEEVMPFIESTYRVARTPELRGVGGSSLGGLISMYMGWERPDVFGSVMAMSSSFQFREIIDVVAGAAENRDIVVYLDSGNAGTSNDGMFNTNEMRDVLLGRGYVLGRNLRHVIGYGHEHNEAAWQQRFPGALRLLFGSALFVRTPGDVNGDGFGPNVGDAIASVNLATMAGNAPRDAKARAHADWNGDGVLLANDLEGMAGEILGAE